uniref:Uncharacterized protein n=1 Tax=Phytophthora ramorum TaxID=164328 RepID=H3HDW4_PHYRM
MQYQTSYPYATTSQHYGASSHPREEQRRRQQEYSQALAQQVAQRDQQKQREREKDHQHGRNSFQSQPPFEQRRRQRTDIHDGSRGDSEEADRFRRKLQQQQEMQLALERQIEEKRQQKLEAKRRQEEEDRREMERFEEDKRRQRAEEERLQEEKRRKAEIEQQKAQQAAAAVAAANEQAKLQQQQKLHAQISQPQLQHPQHDPPPQRGPMAPDNHFGYSNQNASPMRAGPQGFGQVFPQENAAVGRLLDPTELRRQYDDMREELRRQKQLVDELRQAQVQIQQQQQQLSPAGTESGSIPTLMDLEKLRNELRGELDYREQIHRQEIDSLKREQQHERSPAHSPHRYPGIPSVLSSPSPRKKSGKWRLESMGANDASDSDDDLDASLDGEQLEALFQRNVRRHEILLGFQTKVQAQVQDSNQQEA